MVLRFFILAVAFLLSCTSIERDSVCDEKSVYYNGCVGGVSSSSSESGTVPSSSSSEGGTVPSSSSSYPSKGIDMANYKKVLIGTQVWMSENLDYDVPGSKCYDNDIANCIKYGRLYDWKTAMDLPANCNTNTCSEQIGIKYKGICPSGWHITTREELEALENYIGGSTGPQLDKYGFSAQPSGYGSSDGGFGGIGVYSYFWSRSEFSDNYAFYVSIYHLNGSLTYANGVKNLLFSVRCVQD